MDDLHPPHHFPTGKTQDPLHVLPLLVTVNSNVLMYLVPHSNQYIYTHYVKKKETKINFTATNLMAFISGLSDLEHIADTTSPVWKIPVG